MKPIEMARECLKAMELGPDRRVMFTIPKGSMPKTFPNGELANEMKRDGQVVRTYWFKPMRVISWLAQNHMIYVERGERENTLIVKEVS